MIVIHNHPSVLDLKSAGMDSLSVKKYVMTRTPKKVMAVLALVKLKMGIHASDRQKIAYQFAQKVKNLLRQSLRPKRTKQEQLF